MTGEVVTGGRGGGPAGRQFFQLLATRRNAAGEKRGGGRRGWRGGGQAILSAAGQAGQGLAVPAAAHGVLEHVGALPHGQRDPRRHARHHPGAPPPPPPNPSRFTHPPRRPVDDGEMRAIIQARAPTRGARRRGPGDERAINRAPRRPGNDRPRRPATWRRPPPRRSRGCRPCRPIQRVCVRERVRAQSLERGSPRGGAACASTCRL